MSLSFIFGGDTGLSYDQIQTRRKMAEAMGQQNGTPRNVGEGINSFAGSIAGAMMGRRLDKADRANQAKSDELYSNIFGGFDGGGGYSAPNISTSGAPSQYNAMAANGGPTNAAASAMTGGDNASVIRSGLIERGLPEYIADGFVMNFQDESGLDPGINEISPTVPGSRGGFGLAQWTGPRRRQLEAFAQSRGAPPSDINTQLDFLVSELGGSESRAAQSILSTKNSGQAATAIVNDFLRPAEENRARRVARYGGGQTSKSARESGPQSGGGNIAQIAQALGDPYIQRDPGKVAILQAMMQREMAASQPMSQLEQIQLQQAQLNLEQDRNPTPDQTSAMQNYDFLISQGMDPSEAMKSAFGGGGVNVDVSTGQPIPEIGTIPQGYEAYIDPRTGQRAMRQIPGGPEDTSKQQELQAGSARISSDTVSTAARRAREAVAKQDAGPAGTSLIGQLPWTDSAEVMRQVDVLKSQAAVGNLNSMRAQSPTGGALGNVTEKELKLLQDQSGALNPNSPTFLRDLDDYERTLLRTIHGDEAGDRLFQQSRGGAAQTAPVTSIPANPSPNEIDDSTWSQVWENMSPEDRRLFAQ